MHRGGGNPSRRLWAATRSGGRAIDVVPVPIVSTASWDFAGEARELLRGSFAAPKLAGVLCRCERHYVPPTCPYL